MEDEYLTIWDTETGELIQALFISPYPNKIHLYPNHIQVQNTLYDISTGDKVNPSQCSELAPLVTYIESKVPPTRPDHPKYVHPHTTTPLAKVNKTLITTTGTGQIVFLRKYNDINS